MEVVAGCADFTTSTPRNPPRDWGPLARTDRGIGLRFGTLLQTVCKLDLIPAATWFLIALHQIPFSKARS